jgi:hypothetical protein
MEKSREIELQAVEGRWCLLLMNSKILTTKSFFTVKNAENNIGIKELTTTKS